MYLTFSLSEVICAELYVILLSYHLCSFSCEKISRVGSTLFDTEATVRNLSCSCQENVGLN